MKTKTPDPCVTLEVKIINNFIVMKSKRTGTVITLMDLSAPNSINMADIGRVVFRLFNEGLKAPPGGDKKPRWVKLGEAAKILGISQMTARRMEKRGLLTPVRTPGGHRRYEENEVMATKEKGHF